jgi:hypothetical protein
VKVSWSAPSDGGARITSYEVTASRGHKTCKTASLECVVDGLTNGICYRFSVKATNAIGSGAASPKSAPRIPTGPVTISPFKYRSSVLTSTLKSEIDALAKLIAADGFTSVELAGYTAPGHGDPRQLGLAQAAAVGEYLSERLRPLGVSRLTLTGLTVATRWLLTPPIHQATDVLRLRCRMCRRLRIACRSLMDTTPDTRVPCEKLAEGARSQSCLRSEGLRSPRWHGLRRITRAGCPFGSGRVVALKP